MNVSVPFLADIGSGSMPRAPLTVRETGLDTSFLLDLLIKTIFRIGMERPSRMATELKLTVPIIEEIIEIAKAKELLFLLGQPGANMAAEMRYQLSAKGREWAIAALGENAWTGAAPVPFKQFVAQVRAQSIRHERLTETGLKKVMRDLILPTEVMDQIGPAINSGASILFYGPPGNGKSSIAEAICSAYENCVYLPHAISIGADVIVFFDSAVHTPVTLDQANAGLRRQKVLDERYVPCRRPHVITGGELTTEKFDVVRNPTTGLYDAPLQLKAAGGIFVVDDFGRQRQSPQSLINRLIIPLENGTDHMLLESGRKIEVPFDTLVVFATNYEPRSLMDEAGLRRLRHKIMIDRPDLKTFVKILLRTAAKSNLDVTEDFLAHLLFELYGNNPQTRYNAFHARFLIDQCASICSYQGLEPQLTPAIVDQAWANLTAAH